jgi:hypothetical protein
MSSMPVTDAVSHEERWTRCVQFCTDGIRGAAMGNASRRPTRARPRVPGKHARRTHGNLRTLLLDDHRSPDLDNPVVHLDDILVPHTRASVAHGLVQLATTLATLPPPLRPRARRTRARVRDHAEPHAVARGRPRDRRLAALGYQGNGLRRILGRATLSRPFSAVGAPNRKTPRSRYTADPSPWGTPTPPSSSEWRSTGPVLAAKDRLWQRGDHAAAAAWPPELPSSS